MPKTLGKPKKEFKFDEKEHAYFLDDKPMIGVTTVLQVIAKPMLIQWAANCAVDHIEEVFKTTPVWRIAEALPLSFSEARSAHRKKKESAGTKGTEVHAIIEEIVKKAIEENKGCVTLALHENAQVNHFLTWARDNKVKFLESEKRVYSEEHWYAGTLDLVFEMDGKRWIGDVKTSSGIYNEHFFQMGGYEIALEEMGCDKVDGYLVINLKKDGTFDLKMAENREINKEAFKHALGLHKIIGLLK